MGNQLINRISPAVVSGAIFAGKIGLIIIALAILGFIIYKIVKYVRRDEYEDDETNYKEDLQCLNKDRGKSKNNI